MAHRYHAHVVPMTWRWHTHAIPKAYPSRSRTRRRRDPGHAHGIPAAGPPRTHCISRVGADPRPRDMHTHSVPMVPVQYQCHVHAILGVEGGPKPSCLWHGTWRSRPQPCIRGILPPSYGRRAAHAQHVYGSHSPAMRTPSGPTAVPRQAGSTPAKFYGAPAAYP